uniref:Uncharacterized protein n=1 Tax=Ananas comosus var. bracteatus TaxID=296719 RepID=A0A6V7P5R7_ANACO|nr:unnamed protein product [Ananas comosus var. bracteatus]
MLLAFLSEKRKGSISRKSQLQKLEPSGQQQQNTTNLQGEPQHLSVILLPIHLLQQQTAKSLLTAVFSSAPPPSSPISQLLLPVLGFGVWGVLGWKWWGLGLGEGASLVWAWIQAAELCLESYSISGQR